jgi:hypothetical protein
MYHGTRVTPPIAIYSSEEGFDTTYSRDGMWGHANYFAMNSKYSNDYAFTATGNGTKQMFCAKVLIGKSCVLGPDQSIQRPPLIAGT